MLLHTAMDGEYIATVPVLKVIASMQFVIHAWFSPRQTRGVLIRRKRHSV